MAVAYYVLKCCINEKLVILKLQNTGNIFVANTYINLTIIL